MSVASEGPVVLVVEDEVLILLNTVDELERANISVFEAVNADIAIGVLEMRADITHIFSDIDLPGQIDGLQLAALVRNRWPDIHVILTSGHMLPHTIALPEGAVFFPKPYSLTDIRASISEVSDLR